MVLITMHLLQTRTKMLLTASMLLGSIVGYAQNNPENNVSKLKVPKTSVLFIRGPEVNGKTISYEEAQNEVTNFKAVFADYNVKVVGNGKEDITIPQVIDSLNSLAETKPERMLVISYLHGDSLTVKNKKEGTYRRSNLVKMAKENLVSADSLLKIFGKAYEANENLRGVKMDNVYFSCFGGGALEGFHYLPANTRVFYYTDSRNNEYSLRNYNSFALAFLTMLKNKQHPVLDEKGIFATAVFASNIKMNDRPNDLHFLQIGEATADTIYINKKKFFFGQHNSRLIHPAELIEKLTDAKRKKLEKAMKDYETYLPPDQQRAVLAEKRENEMVMKPVQNYQKVILQNVAYNYIGWHQAQEDETFQLVVQDIHKLQPSNTPKKQISGEAWDRLALMALLYEMQENKSGNTGLSYAKHEKLIGIYPTKPVIAAP